MRNLVVGLALALFSTVFTLPVLADDGTEADYLFTFDVGPGLLKAVDDTTDAAGVEAYIAGAIQLHKRFALGVRLSATSTEGVESVKISGRPWGFLRGFLTGVEGGLRTYLEVAVNTEGTIALRGGAEVGVSEGVAMFATVDGRKVSETEAKDLIGLSAGIRAGFGSR